MKIVPIKHPGNKANIYTFQTPVDLEKGDIVLCNTSKGFEVGRCECDSMELEGNALEYIMQKLGAKISAGKEPAWIVGRYSLCMFGGVEADD